MTDIEQSDGQYSQFKGWHEEEFGLCKRHWAAYYKKELNACRRARGAVPRGESLRLLEIGFGNGAFLSWARDQGHVIFGVEIEPSRLAAARNAGFTVAASIAELETMCDLRLLDGLVAFDVFEHLTFPQLIDLLKQLRGLLKPQGWIMARFPNGDSPFGRLNQHGDLTHVTSLGSMAMRQLGVATRLRVVSVASEGIPVRGIGPLRGAVNVARVFARAVLELPLQLLLNVYYPGDLRWYPLAPNLVARFVKP